MNGKGEENGKENKLSTIWRPNELEGKKMGRKRKWDGEDFVNSLIP